ncbi:MAG: CTQ-dependent glycine oxidase GoxA [Verrucomicrobiota bacterium]
MRIENKNQNSRLIPRRDFLSQSALTLAGLGLVGATRATVAAPEKAKLAPKGAKIESIAIFPAIGLCRVGNSEKFFYAPEVPGVAPDPEGGFKDGVNKYKKQVQRFRIYGFDAKGRVVREISKDAGDDIEWSVHLANTKGAWYEFNSPMDMGMETPGLTGQLRNQFFNGSERESLLIDPGLKQIRSNETDGVELVGSFWKQPDQVSVKLGELKVDEAGRLLVFPGDGKGASVTPVNPIASFSDNDGWYDDWCDGPVHAAVTLKGGEELKAEGAWVTCCGPNFSPEINAFITLYDVVRDVMVNGKDFAGKEPLEPQLKRRISFLEEVYPLFLRLGQMEWLANAAQLREGWIDAPNFLDEATMQKLADPSPQNAAYRMSVFKMFRDPASEKIEQYKLPFMLGSGANYDFSPAHWFLMPKLQYDVLTKWAKGEFENDLEREESKIRSLDEVALEHQPDALTRAALEPCSGGAFHPGVEMTWPLRQEALFRDDLPYRIAEGNRSSLLQNDVVGRLMTPVTAFNSDDALRGDPEHRSGEAFTFVPGKGAPIGPQMAGDLTRWLGLPWFGDAFSCGLAIEYANEFPNAIWWPALTPIDVLPELYYNQIAADEVSDADKLKFFEKRVPWVRGVRGIGLHVQASYIDGLARNVDLWSRLGIVVKKKRPDNLSPELKKIIPEEIFVEMERGSMDLMTDQAPNPGRHAPIDSES